MNSPQQPNPIATQLPTPQLPIPQANPGFPLDPTNPLVWVILLTALLSNLDEPIQATADLVKSLTDLLKSLTRPK